MKKYVIGAILSIAIIGFMSVERAQAMGPAQPSCGETITKNVKLTGDLDCSLSSGTDVALTVGDDNITINLGGYAILGPKSLGDVGVGACPAFFSSTPNRTIGILVDGWNNTKILNGAVNDFEYGIIVKNAEGVRINNIYAVNNLFNALSVGDFDGLVASPLGGVPDLDVNGVYFQDTRNDHIGVSADSSMSLLNSHLTDGCASGIFAAPLSTGGFPPGTPLANAEIKNSWIVDNFRSAVNFWGATGSVENSLIKGNNSNTAFSGGSDFGQISLTSLEGGDILIRCNEIRDSLDANGNAIERAIGFKGPVADTTVEVTKNLIANNPVATWFGGDGSVVVVVDIHRNTFDTNTTDFAFPGSNWTVDADKNFYVAGAPTSNGNDGALTTDPILNSAQHCR